MATIKAPNYWVSLFNYKCPRCRTGNMFTSPTLFNKKFMQMPDRCNCCNQKNEMEVGFWQGTSYVSYALTIAFSVSTFVAWFVLIGFNIYDNRIFWWLGTNIVLLLVLQPWFMRISRVVYLRFFVSYNPNWKTEKPVEFDHGE